MIDQDALSQIIDETEKTESTIEPKQTVTLDSIIDENESANLNNSAFHANTKDTNQYVEVLKLADKVRAEPSFVEQNYSPLKQESDFADLKKKLSDTQRSAPKTIDWLKNPDILAVSKSHIDQLARQEKDITDYNNNSQSYNALMGGISQAYQMIAQAPAYIGNVSLIPSNLVRKALGMEQVSYDYDNQISKYYGDVSQKFFEGAPDAQGSWTEKLMDGDIAGAGRTLGLQVIANIPSQTAIALSAIGGNPMLGLGYAGLTTASGKASEMQKEGIEPVSAPGIAAAHGAIEAAFESLGTLPAIKRAMEAAGKDFSKQTMKEFIFNAGKTISANFFQEGLEEFGTSLAQDFTDYVTGVNPDAMKGSIGRAIDAFGVGAASGGGTTALILTGGGLQKRSQIKQAETNQNFFLNLAKNAEESELRKKLPEKYQEHLENLTKDGPVENVYIDLDGFLTLFQSDSQKTPAQIANELGFSEQFDKAMETGNDIEIKTSEFATKVAGTGYFQSISDHIKFQSDQLTPSQAREAKSELNTEFQKQYEEATKDKSPDAIAENEKSANLVGEDIANQLVEQNAYSPKAAKLTAQVWTEFFKTMGLKTGVAPFELYKNYGVKIKNGTFADFAQMNPQGIQANTLVNDFVSTEVIQRLQDKFTYSQVNDVHNLNLNNSKESVSFDFKNNQVSINQANITSIDSLVDFVKAAQTIGERINMQVFMHKEALAQLPQIEEQVIADRLVKEGYTYAKDADGNIILNKAVTLYQEDYWMDHRPPNYENGASLYDLTQNGIYPNDIYSENGLKYYGTGESVPDSESMSVIQSVKGNPNAVVKIYRAVPDNLTNEQRAEKLKGQLKAYMKSGRLPKDAFTKDKTRWYEETSNEVDKLMLKPNEGAVQKPIIKNGDWVTLSKSYAKQHGESQLGGNYKILTKSVLAKELFTNGDSINEFGYWSIKKAKTLYQSPQTTPQKTLGMFSKLQETILQKMANTQDVSSLKAMLKDIKADEMKWSGLDEYLKGKQKVNKQDVLDFLRANQLQISEVTKDSFYKIVDNPESNKNDFPFAVIEKSGAVLEVFKNREEAVSFANKQPSEELDASYGQYTLPNGENYREVLFTLPELTPEIKKLPEGYSFQERKIETPFGLSEGFIVVNEQGERVGTQMPSKEAAERSALRALNQEQLEKKQDFTSSHWKEKNVLAFVRLNDRIDSEGKKVLFVEEIQSDWGQEGRKRGFKGSEEYTKLDKANESNIKKITETKEKWTFKIKDTIEDKLLEVNVYKTEYDSKTKSKIDLGLTEERAKKIALEKVNESIDRIEKQINEQKNSNKVPQMPFSKNWHEFAFKRILTMASEQGYDRVAWTTGEQQTERYNLSKQVDKVIYNKSSQTLGIFKDDKNILTKNVPESELDSVVGKDLAQKIIENKDKYQSYSGIDLKVGGEGMKGFYDKILVDYAKKIGKKFKAEVKDIKIPNIDSVHSIDISQELKDVAIGKGFELFQDKKGAITFGPQRQFNISLFESKDESTFLHESAHFFLEVMGDMSEMTDAPQSIKDDYNTLLEWMGASTRQSITTEMHEKLARGFESYLMEGKAPTSKLRKAFTAFKNWLLLIYKDALNLNVNVSEEVKQVFDRMLSAERAIEDAEKKLGERFLFKDIQNIGMNFKSGVQYLKALEEARDIAKDQIRAKLMKALLKKKDSDYKEAYNILYDQEMEKAKELRQFKVIEQITGDMKLSTQVIDNEYSAFKDSLPIRSTKKENGTHPNIVASIFGYDNGQQMLQDIAPYRTGVEDYVESQVATLMKEKYPDLLESPELSEEAITAYHNENMAEVKKLEMKILIEENPNMPKQIARQLIKRVPISSEVKDQARNLIANTKLTELKPHVYRNAERKFASQSAKFFGQNNYEAAFEAKRKEYLNFELYRASIEAKETIEKGDEFFKKVFQSDEKIAKLRDMDIVNAAQAILANFGYGKTEKTAEDYLKSMSLYDPEGYEVILNRVNEAKEITNKKENTTFEDYVNLKETIEALWDLARSRNQIEIEGEMIEFDKVTTELVDQLQKHRSEVKDSYTKEVSTWGKITRMYTGAKAELTRVEHWTKAIDLGDQGKFWRYIFRPISDSIAKYKLKKIETLKKYKSIIDNYKKNITHDKIVSDELKHIFSNKAELMMAILHTGNESNKNKLLYGRGWADISLNNEMDSSRWDSFINRMHREGVLKKEDYDFAQGIWDLLESLKPEAQKSHKKMFGFYFNEITSKEIKTPFGNYRGGYIPAKADIYLVQDAKIREERDLFEKNNANWQFPTTGRGFTKSRKEMYRVPLSLDMNMLASHIDGVLRFSYIEPHAKNISKLVINKSFRSMLDAISPDIAHEMLIPWLQRSAQQKTTIPNQGGLYKTIDSVASYLRKNAAMQIMFMNIPNAAQQITGLFITASKVHPRYLKNAIYNYTFNNKDFINSIHVKSEWMKSTQGENIFDIQNGINEILFKESVYANAKEFASRHVYLLQSASQNIVNSITWNAAYEQAIVNGMNENQAVKEADSTVRRTQGTTNPEDISRFETGSPTALLFKQFVSYFNMLANFNVSEIYTIQKSFGLRKGAGKLFYLYVMAFMLPAVLSELIVKASGNKLDEDDDGEYIDDILMTFFGSQFKTILAPVPYAGMTLLPTIEAITKENLSYNRLNISPVVSIIEQSVKTPRHIYDIMTGESVKKSQVKDILQTLGIMSGLPIGVVGRPVGYLMDVDEGKKIPENALDFIRGVITGK